MLLRILLKSWSFAEWISLIKFVKFLLKIYSFSVVVSRYFEVFIEQLWLINQYTRIENRRCVLVFVCCMFKSRFNCITSFLNIVHVQNCTDLCWFIFVWARHTSNGIYWIICSDAEKKYLWFIRDIWTLIINQEALDYCILQSSKQAI